MFYGKLLCFKRFKCKQSESLFECDNFELGCYV